MSIIEPLLFFSDSPSGTEDNLKLPHVRLSKFKKKNERAEVVNQKHIILYSTIMSQANQRRIVAETRQSVHVHCRQCHTAQV